MEIRCKTGLPLPLVELRVVDEDMNDLPHDGTTSGEVVVRSPWLTQRLPQGPANLGTTLARRLPAHRRHRHHRPGRLSQDHRSAEGRDQDRWRMDPSLELEDLILKHPAVTETAVVGIPDPKWGERPLALVVLKPDRTGQVDEATICDWLKDFADKGIISKWGIPDRVLFVDSIPKTSVGKLNKKEMRQQYAQAIKVVERRGNQTLPANSKAFGAKLLEIPCPTRLTENIQEVRNGNDAHDRFDCGNTGTERRIAVSGRRATDIHTHTLRLIFATLRGAATAQNPASLTNRRLKAPSSFTPNRPSRRNHQRRPYRHHHALMRHQRQYPQRTHIPRRGRHRTRLATPNDRIQVQDYRGVRYTSGGVGESERAELNALSGQFNLRLLFAMQGSGDYLADTKVIIADKRGETVLSAMSNGPGSTLQLPPGTYTVEVSTPDQTQRQPVTIGTRQSD